jgi:hypothetical protein
VRSFAAQQVPQFVPQQPPQQAPQQGRRQMVGLGVLVGAAARLRSCGSHFVLASAFSMRFTPRQGKTRMEM